MNPLDWLRDLEKWVWEKTEEHPAWNALTWAGHGAAVVIAAMVFGFLGGVPDIIAAFFVSLFGGEGTNLALEWSRLAGSSLAGYYVWREVVELYRGKHASAKPLWKWGDHLMDALAPILAAIWLV